MMSMPSSTCLRTTSPTASCKRRACAASSTGLPCCLASITASTSGGRGRLPTWVVRMRSLLRFIACFPRIGAAVDDRGHELHQSALPPWPRYPLVLALQSQHLGDRRRGGGLLLERVGKLVRTRGAPCPARSP